MNFKEKCIYKINDHNFECYRIDFPYFYFHHLETRAIYKLHKTCDYFSLIKFVELSPLEKEIA